jgi:hypothetical protein
MIEALGVPRTEVEWVLANGESVGFERALSTLHHLRSLRSRMPGRNALAAHS